MGGGRGKETKPETEVECGGLHSPAGSVIVVMLPSMLTHSLEAPAVSRVLNGRTRTATLMASPPPPPPPPDFSFFFFLLFADPDGLLIAVCRGEGGWGKRVLVYC